MEIQATRDLFEHRYYKINKMLLKWVGLWPYQTTRARSVLFAIEFSIVVSQLAAQAIATAKHRNDWESLIECIMPLTFDAFCITKFFTSVVNAPKMLGLLNRMRTNWYVRARDRGGKIFHEYAENGRKMTIAYTVMGYTTWVLFVTQPIVPKVIDIVLRNGTEPGEFVLRVDYLVIDLQKYYFYIVLHTATSGFLIFTISVAFNSMFVVYVQHCCGLYAALGHHLEQIGKKQRSSETEENTYVLDESDVTYEHLVTCIARHNGAIKYSELIEASYSWGFLFIVGFNMVIISLTGLEIVMRTTNPQQTVKFIAANIVSMVPLFIENYMAQILMDHSIKIRSYIFNSEWYKLPLKAQKVLLFMIMRCNAPSQLTAGKMCVMSVQSFGMFLNRSLSYFTLLHSM